MSRPTYSSFSRFSNGGKSGEVPTVSLPAVSSCMSPEAAAELAAVVVEAVLPPWSRSRQGP